MKGKAWYLSLIDVHDGLSSLHLAQRSSSPFSLCIFATARHFDLFNRSHALLTK